MKAKIFYLCVTLLIPALGFGQWEIQSTGFADSLRGLEQIWAVDNNIVWAIANDGSGNDSIIQEFTRTIDGGTTWTPGIINGAVGLTPTGIFALNADTAWTLLYNPDTDGGKVFRTNDGGVTWVHQPTALFVDTLEAYPNLIYFWNENDGFCMGDPTNDYFEIYTTSDGGNLWTRVDSTNMPMLIPGEWGYAGYFSVVDNTFWFGTSKGNIYKTTDKGHTWSSISNPFLNIGKIRIIQFTDTLNGIIGDRTNNTFSLYKTDDGGATWQPITPTGTVYGRSISYVPGTPGTLISTSNATALSGSSISYDFGDTWTDIPGSAGVGFTCLGNFQNQTGWAGLKNESSTVGGIARYKVLSYDAGISQLVEPIEPCEGTYPIVVTVTNYGNGLIDNVSIVWEMNGVVQPMVNYNTMIPAGQSADVYLGTTDFVFGTYYFFYGYTINPNGMVDIDLTNDVFSTPIEVHETPFFNLGNDTVMVSNQSLLLTAPPFSGLYLWSTGQTTQSLGVDIPPTGTGELIVWVEVTSQYGCVGSDTIVIQYGPNGIEEAGNSSTMMAYPNPSNGIFSIQLPKGQALSNITVFDNTGRQVYAETYPSGNKVDLKSFKEGIYIIKAVSKEKVYWEKVVLQK
ncbi:MAG: T9SS type A sorting domain-containing protein [Bacteroidales bacterium]|nr:T9SS type A sorting domain-containing protein [Bacteroidales bacterium]MCF8455555.1 T9SS type A sorting domain-containing protein [Bacteroidales bacterium]